MKVDEDSLNVPGKGSIFVLR